MSAVNTPSKTAPIDCTYSECSWSVHANGNLFVRLSPNLAGQLNLKKQVHIRYLGSVTKVAWSSKLRTREATHSNVFKFLVRTQPADESQDVDKPAEEWYALKEERFSDFETDPTAKKMTTPAWKTNSTVKTAFNVALDGNKLGKKGEWLKKVSLSEILETQAEAELDEEAPDSFGYTPTGKSKSGKGESAGGTRRYTREVEEHDDEESNQPTEVVTIDDADEEEDPEVMSLASQQAYNGTKRGIVVFVKIMLP